MRTTECDRRIGIIIDDRYLLSRMIEAGGFGTVFEAFHVGLARRVALKFLNTNDEEDSKRLLQEAKLLSVIKHQNVVSVYGYGQWQNRPYVAMEYLPGHSLATRLAAEEHLEIGEALRITSEIAAGLKCVHESNIVHRDLKPDNLMLLPDGRVRIIDFGLAKPLLPSGLAKQRLTMSGFTVGTAHYLSPEQCRGEQTDARSDLYACGCILFECLTGRPVFSGSSSFELMQKHLMETPDVLALTESFNGIDARNFMRALQRILNGCLDKNVDMRFANADDLLHAVAEAQALYSRLPASSKCSSALATKKAFIPRADKKRVNKVDPHLLSWLDQPLRIPAMACAALLSLILNT